MNKIKNFAIILAFILLSSCSTRLTFLKKSATGQNVEFLDVKKIKNIILPKDTIFNSISRSFNLVYTDTIKLSNRVIKLYLGSTGEYQLSTVYDSKYCNIDCRKNTFTLFSPVGTPISKTEYLDKILPSKSGNDYHVEFFYSLNFPINFSYTYDENGEVASAIDNEVKFEFGFDKVLNLIQKDSRLKPYMISHCGIERGSPISRIVWSVHYDVKLPQQRVVRRTIDGQSGEILTDVAYKIGY